MAVERLLVPVEKSVTLRRTVGYAVETALDSAADRVEIHFVAAMTYEAESPGGTESIEEAEELLERLTVWAYEDANEEAFDVETAVIGTDRYLFSPRDFGDRLADYADDHGIDLIILDPEYLPGSSAPMLQPLEHQLESHGLDFEEAPVEPARRSGQLITPGGASRLGALFAVSFGFYLVLGDPTYPFDLVTGAVSGLIVAITLSHVTFSRPPTLRQTPIRALRFVVYVPYLLYEIVKANVAVSIAILRPSMPIEPRMTRLRSTVWGGLPLTTLANSITLTPGTLTVRANDQNLIVHTLIPDAREDLFDGGLERGVRFVFYGRDAARIPSPRERDDAEIIGEEER
ncbi:monovalent cation/H+ antiporter subunit E [Halalkalicoccus ordinarius]|uniref:monovalent cation/H+ antiporter subunit E n=1 Tax=Halalkalicoccus ordinarius TaxID=3116651 RepID=UPI00300F7B45